jgi:PKHD-type hydroxylase
MQLTNSYFYFKSAISKEDCQKIIDAGEVKLKSLASQGNSLKGYTAGDGQIGSKPNTVPANDLTKEELRNNQISNFYDRDSKVAWLNDYWIYDLIHPYIHKANNQAGWNFDWDYSEPAQYTVYESSGFYSWHTDGGSDHASAYKRYIFGITPEPMRSEGRFPDKFVNDPGMVGKVRKLSVTLTLNDPSEYEGGLLKFDLSQHADNQRFHQLEDATTQGTITVFPSFIPHCITPITKGIRKSLVIWNLGYPFK